MLDRVLQVCSVLQNEGRCWTEFYKYVKRRKGNIENIQVIKDHNGTLITDPLEKANSLNSYYASLFSCERNNPQVQSIESGKPSPLKKSVGPDGIPGEILKLGETAGYYDE
jgi:hypothetical protein